MLSSSFAVVSLDGHKFSPCSPLKSSRSDWPISRFWNRRITGFWTVPGLSIVRKGLLLFIKELYHPYWEWALLCRFILEPMSLSRRWLLNCTFHSKNITNHIIASWAWIWSCSQVLSPAYPAQSSLRLLIIWESRCRHSTILSTRVRSMSDGRSLTNMESRVFTKGSTPRYLVRLLEWGYTLVRMKALFVSLGILMIILLLKWYHSLQAASRGVYRGF